MFPFAMVEFCGYIVKGREIEEERCLCLGHPSLNFTNKR
jgi:hypothetical protein